MELWIHYRPVTEETSGWSWGPTWPTAVLTWDFIKKEECKVKGGPAARPYPQFALLDIYCIYIAWCCYLSTFFSPSQCRLPVSSISDVNKVQPTLNEPLEVVRTSQNVLIFFWSSPWRCTPRIGSHKDKSLRLPLTLCILCPPELLELYTSIGDLSMQLCLVSVT